MSKITRDKLARGAKLLIEHIFSPLQSGQTQLTTSNIEQEQLEADYAPFRLNWSIPRLDSYACGIQDPSGRSPLYGIPFMLPPLQDTLSYTTDARGGKVMTVSDDTPAIILDEVSVSFDQRSEPAAILSNWAEGNAAAAASADQGKLCYERTGNLDLEFAILEKTPGWANPATITQAVYPSRVVWSGSLSGSLDVNDGYFRLNPWVVSSIREELDPFKSYVFSILAPKLSDTRVCELVSLEISLRFLTPLIDRNESVTIQNLPYRHRGAKNAFGPPTVTGAGTRSATARPLITAVPAAGASIQANTASGAQTSMAVIDEMMRSKLQGGYTMDSNVPMHEELKDSAAYTVIAVPLFNNTRNGGVDSATVAGEPYITSTTSNIIDRRYVPIVAPMTIHHVLYTWNWFNWAMPDGGGGLSYAITTPYNAGGVAEALKLEVGVGIGTGARADNYDCEQVASATIHSPTTTNWRGSAVDLISFGDPASMPYIGNPALGLRKPWNIEVYAADIVGAGSPGLNGMTAQGRPFFVGRSRTSTSSRTGLTAGGSAATGGAEQWLEVRARLSDNAGATWPTYNTRTILTPALGMWVYIIGKTNLI